MFYSMGRSLALSEDSAVKAIESLQNSSAVLPARPFISAALVSRQIKAIMMLLLEEFMQNLLKGLEHELRHDSSSWAICFSTILVLCILAGQVDIATDAMVIHKTACEGHDASDTRKNGIEASQALGKAMNYAWEMFSGIQGKRNPVSDNRPINYDLKQNKEEADFIDEINKLLKKYGMYTKLINNAPLTGVSEDEISELATWSCLGGSSDTPADHNRFRARSSHHYLCKFLRAFC
jgi:hypothetical protein